MVIGVGVVGEVRRAVVAMLALIIMVLAPVHGSDCIGDNRASIGGK